MEAYTGGGSKNPFFAQFQDVVSTALRSSIQFTNRIKGHSPSIPDHAAVAHVIMKHRPDKARVAMKKIVSDVLELIDTIEPETKVGSKPSKRR